MDYSASYLLLWIRLIFIIYLMTDRVTSTSDRELLKVAYGNIKRESSGAATTLEHGLIPQWLDGTFIRQSCGAFGEVDSVGYGFQNQGFYNYIDHVFDCFNTGTNFKLQDGQATFTNKFWPTAIKKVYDDFHQNMNESRNFHRGVLASFDYDQKVKLEPNVSQYRTPLVPGSFPQVNFWQIGNRVAAWDEATGGQWINVHTVDGLGNFPFEGEDIWRGVRAINNPAHEHVDREGNLWSMSGAYSSVGGNVAKGEWVVYKVTPDRRREVIARHETGRYNLSLCINNQPYPLIDDRHGYIHSFGMSENYIVIPMTSWLSDPCSLFVYGMDNRKPFFRSLFTWYDERQSSLIVIRKSDGIHMGTAYTKAFFITHMLNTYEDGELIHVDMLAYKNSTAYEDTTVLDNLFENNLTESSLERMTINTTDWTVERRSLRVKVWDKMEMTNINYKYNGLPYKYGYLIVNPFILDGYILKLNVETGEEMAYLFPPGQLPNEPIFVERPGATEEDDGVLLVQGIDVNTKKAFLTILDAKTMTLEAKVGAPELALFGLHNRFYPCSVGGSADNDTTACISSIGSTQASTQPTARTTERDINAAPISSLHRVLLVFIGLLYIFRY